MYGVEGTKKMPHKARMNKSAGGFKTYDEARNFAVNEKWVNIQVIKEA